MSIWGKRVRDARRDGEGGREIGDGCARRAILSLAVFLLTVSLSLERLSLWPVNRERRPGRAETGRLRARSDQAAPRASSGARAPRAPRAFGRKSWRVDREKGARAGPADDAPPGSRVVGSHSSCNNTNRKLHGRPAEARAGWLLAPGRLEYVSSARRAPRARSASLATVLVAGRLVCRGSGAQPLAGSARIAGQRGPWRPAQPRILAARTAADLLHDSGKNGKPV